MKPLEIVLIIACVAIVVGVVVSRIIKKKKGIPTCDCGCDGCSGCSCCDIAKLEELRSKNAE